MRTARVIPCLDVTGGRVVKGVNFVGLRDAGDPVELAARYDAEGADELVFLDITASSDGRGWEVYVHGGRTPTDQDAVAWAEEAVRLGAGEILLTSMDRDGTRDGYDCALTRTVADAVSVPVIASGGVGTLQHLVDGVVEGGADAVLAASIFHFAEHSVAEAKATLAAAGITVRPAT